MKDLVFSERWNCNVSIMVLLECLRYKCFACACDFSTSLLSDDILLFTTIFYHTVTDNFQMDMNKLSMCS